jgi:hypothetical protein
MGEVLLRKEQRSVVGMDVMDGMDHMDRIAELKPGTSEALCGHSYLTGLAGRADNNVGWPGSVSDVSRRLLTKH